MKTFIEKLYWLWVKFRGKKYFITYIDELENDEFLVYGHRIYVSKNKNK